MIDNSDDAGTEGLYWMNQIFCDPENWQPWYELALWYRRIEQPHIAHQYLSYALTLDPANEDIINDLAIFII